jgi:hypothetical protein
MCSARLTGHAEIQTQGLNVGGRSDPSHRSGALTGTCSSISDLRWRRREGRELEDKQRAAASYLPSKTGSKDCAAITTS